MTNELAVAKEKTSKTSCTIQAQATPFIVHLNVPESEAKAHLDDCWEKAKATIPPQQWEGFRPGSDAMRPTWEARMGGLTRAYRAAWLDIVHQAARVTERFVLDFQELSVERQLGAPYPGGDSGPVGVGSSWGYTVAAVVTFLPEVHFKTDKLDTIPVELYALHPEFIANVVNQKKSAVVQQHKAYQTTSEPVVDGNRVKISVMAQLDGTPWGPGTGEQTLVITPGNVHPDELRIALLGKKTDEEFDVACAALPPVYGPSAGHAFTARVKVVKIESEVVGDGLELWARAGYISEEEATLALTEQVKKEMLSDRDRNKFDLVLHYLRSNSTCDPVPLHWIRSRSEGEYTTLIQRGPGSEQEILKRHGTTASNLKQHYAVQISDLLRDEVTILAFAKHHGQINYSLDADKNFALARSFLMTKVIATEVTPLSTRKEAAS